MTNTQITSTQSEVYIPRPQSCLDTLALHYGISALVQLICIS